MFTPGFDGALGSAGRIPRLHTYHTLGPGILPTGTVDLTQQLHIWKSQLETAENECKLRSISKPFYALPKAKLDSFTISANLTECILKRKITKIVFFSILVLNDCSAIFLEKNKDKLAVFLTNKQQFLFCCWHHAT